MKLPNKLIFKLYLMLNIPIAYLTGMRLEKLDDKECILSIRKKFLTQNPYKSIYFGPQCMTAEVCVGFPCGMIIHESKRQVSMLVTHTEGDFFKKATGRVRFVTNDVEKLKDGIHKAIETGEAQQVISKATGYNQNGDKVSEFQFTWGFKLKK